MTAIAQRPAWALTGAELLAELDTAQAILSRVQARRLELLGCLDDLGHAKELGARDTTELVAARHRLDPAVVRRDIKHARALASYPVVSASLHGHRDTATHADADAGADPAGEAGAAGEDAQAGEVARGAAAVGVAAGVVVNAAQAQAIVEALERVPVTVPVADVRVAEAELVAAAGTLGPQDLRRLGRAALARLDTDGPEPDEDQAAGREDLWLSPARVGHASGVRFGGFLANANAELFRTLIDAAAKPRRTPAGELDPRTLGQRRADALSVVLHAAAATGGGIPAHGGIKPHLAVTIALADLIEAGRAATGDPTFGDGLSAAAVRALACDAGIIPVVLGSQSEPLDVGREHRFVTPAIRRALIARDRGCVIPGCDAPPGHCDAHHLTHWVDGGATAVDTLALFCKPHHRAIHKGTWTVTITGGQVHVTRPAWAEPGSAGSGTGATESGAEIRPPPQAA